MKKEIDVAVQKSLGINFQQHFHSTGGGEYLEKLFFGRKIEVKKASPFSSKDEIKHAERRLEDKSLLIIAFAK